MHQGPCALDMGQMGEIQVGINAEEAGEDLGDGGAEVAGEGNACFCVGWIWRLCWLCGVGGYIIECTRPKTQRRRHAPVEPGKVPSSLSCSSTQASSRVTYSFADTFDFVCGRGY